MGLFADPPKLLYFVRLLQICLAVVVLILICYAGVHRGWWTNIDGPLAVGVITVIFTLAAGLATIWIHHRSNPFAGGSKLHTILRLSAEVLVFLLWVATATLMLRGHDGCDQRVLSMGQDVCAKGGENYKNWTDQPLITWDIAIAFTFIEIVSFILAIFLVYKIERSSKVPSGGVSYA